MTSKQIFQEEIEWTITRMPGLSSDSREQMAKMVVQQGSTLKVTAAAYIDNALKRGANEAVA